MARGQRHTGAEPHAYAAATTVAAGSAAAHPLVQIAGVPSTNSSMRRLLCAGIILLNSAAYAVEAPTAAEIVARYRQLPHSEEDQLGEARMVRFQTLMELRKTPETAASEIERALRVVKDPRQRVELIEALSRFPKRETVPTLRQLLGDPDPKIRSQAIQAFRRLARTVDRPGAQRQQLGSKFEPEVSGLVPDLIKAASDPAESNRTLALFALADTCDPAAIAAIRERLTDASDDVRFAAACLLTEFQDKSSLNELKRALELFRTDKASKFKADLNSEQLLASLERITGKSFGPVPMNPLLNSDLRRAEEARQRSREMLDSWAAWWTAHPEGQ